jgi:hypothetical protein
MTILWERIHLGAKNIEKAQCLKSWLGAEMILRVMESSEEEGPGRGD